MEMQIAPFVCSNCDRCRESAALFVLWPNWPSALFDIVDIAPRVMSKFARIRDSPVSRRLFWARLLDGRHHSTASRDYSRSRVADGVENWIARSQALSQVRAPEKRDAKGSIRLVIRRECTTLPSVPPDPSRPTPLPAVESSSGRNLANWFVRYVRTA